MAFLSGLAWLLPYAYGLVLVVLIVLVVRIFRSLTAYPGREEFAMALNSQLRHTESAEQLASEIETLFRQVSIRAPQVRTKFRSAADMLADILYDFDVGTSESRFASRTVAEHVLGTQSVATTRPKLVAALGVLRERNPFGSLSGSQASILRTLKEALDAANADLARAALAQIAEDMSSLNGSLAEQERVNRHSIQVSEVSLILTVVFGCASVILFFVQQSATRS